MKWINHVPIAGSMTAIYDVRLVPLTIIGAKALDWMVRVLKVVGKPVKHRTVPDQGASGVRALNSFE